MSQKVVAAFALVGSMAILSWWSCSSDERADGMGGHDGGAEGGGAAGTSPTGGAGGGGATGGSGGSNSDGGIDWGVDPKWESTSASAVGCPIERLTNAAELRVFAWQPCSWSPNDCAQAVFNPKLVGTDARFTPSSSVHDDGVTVRLGLAFQFSSPQSIFADSEGSGLDGVRLDAPSTQCLLASASVWGSRFGATVALLQTQQLGGMVGELGQQGDLKAFTLSAQPPGGPGAYIMGTDRWVWWWSPASALTSVSAVDGSGYAEFASSKSPAPWVYLGPPVSTGTKFLIDAQEGDDAGMAHESILISDGIAAPQTYLKAPDPKDNYGMPIYANSHVAFFRGIGIQDINVYDSVELWTSPYSETPAALQPVKLATIASQSMPTHGARAGGWGFAAFSAFVPPNGERELVIWNLTKGTSRSHVLPDKYDPQGMLGITRTHLWQGAADLGKAPSSHLIRIRLE
jgi:hypothetical protein